MPFSFAKILKTAIFLAFISLFILIIRPFLAPIIMALVFTMIFSPFSNYLGQKLKIKKGFSAFLTVLLSFILILLPLAILALLIGRQSIEFINTLDLEGLGQDLFKLQQIDLWGYSLDLDIMKERLIKILQQSAIYFSSKSGEAISSVSNSFFLFFVFLLLYYYFLKDRTLLFSELKSNLPYRAAEQKKLFKAFKDISKTLFYGNLISALVAGGIAFLGFWMFGLRGALIWALLAAIFSFIPTLGPLVIYLTGIGILLFGSQWLMAILLLCYFILMEVLLRENWIKPKLMEDKLNLHPILVFFALVGGVSAFGSLGLVYGPLIITFFLTFWRFQNLNKK